MALPESGPSADRRRGFSAVDTWVFDLDNTLYPHHLNLWQQVDVRIRDYIVRFFDVTHDEAFRMQKDYYRRYGTTLRGLMTEHGMKPDDFLDFVHQIDHTPIEPNPALGEALEKLPGRKLILTNGTRSHAEAVMHRLKVHKHFEDVFDIVAGELDPKPLPQTYDRFLARHAVDPHKAAIFEDRSCGHHHRLGKKIPRQNTDQQKIRKIYYRRLENMAKNKAIDQNKQQGIRERPQKPQYRVSVFKL